MLKLVGLLLLVSLAEQIFAHHWDRRICLTEADCNPGECCVKDRQYLIATRRDTDGLTGILPLPPQNGTCGTFRTEGQNCNPIYTCGCVSGLECTFTPRTTLKRKMAPGKHRCTVPEATGVVSV